MSQGNGAWFSAAIMVFIQVSAAVQVLFEAFFVDETLTDIFDAVLISKGCASLVETRRTVYPRDISKGITNPVQQLGPHHHPPSAIYAPFSWIAFLSSIVFFPVVLIPLVGASLFRMLRARIADYINSIFATNHHYRYFELLGIRAADRRKLMERDRDIYAGFESTALFLQLIPGISMVFLLTTAAGAALWAADLEKKRRRVGTSMSAISIREL